MSSHGDPAVERDRPHRGAPLPAAHPALPAPAGGLAALGGHPGGRHLPRPPGLPRAAPHRLAPWPRATPASSTRSATAGCTPGATPSATTAPPWPGGRYLSWLGDDDVYLEGAFRSIARALHRYEDDPRVFLFRWIAPWKQVYWEHAGFLAQDHIDAECIVCPNVPDKLGVWNPNRYQGDYDIIAGDGGAVGGRGAGDLAAGGDRPGPAHGRRGLDAGRAGGGARHGAGDGRLMHPEARAFVAAAATRLPPGRVVELGARDFNGTVRDLFPGAPAYVGVDLAAGCGRGRGGRRRRLAPPARASRPRRRCCAARCWSTPRGRGAIVRNAWALLAPGGHLVVTAASTGRPPHSALDGRPAAPRGVLPQRAARGTSRAGSRRPASPSPGSRSTPTGATSTPWPQGRRRVRLLLAHPGASWAVHDVHTGLLAGLRAQGHEVTEYALSGRLHASRVMLEYLWRKQVRSGRAAGGGAPHPRRRAVPRRQGRAGAGPAG